MTTAVFDTLKASRTHKAAGVAEAQAKPSLPPWQRPSTMPLPPKADIAEVRADLKAGIADLKADMLKVAMGVAIAVILANATMTIALIRFLA